MKRVMLVDDDCGALDALAAQLMRQSAGLPLEIHATTDVSAAMRYATRVPVAVAFVDATMPTMDGVVLCRMLGELQPACARALISAGDGLAAAARADNRGGIARHLPKPWPADLAPHLLYLLEWHRDALESPLTRHAALAA
jgi:DNA-binding NtrC family response regulator